MRLLRARMVNTYQTHLKLNELGWRVIVRYDSGCATVLLVKGTNLVIVVDENSYKAMKIAVLEIGVEPVWRYLSEDCAIEVACKGSYAIELI